MPVTITSATIRTKRRNNDDIYTLEEFLEKFPYKVGDKAKLDGWPCIITEMSWWYDDVVYSVKGVDFSKRVCSKDLQPYKEETMEERKYADLSLEQNCMLKHKK